MTYTYIFQGHGIKQFWKDCHYEVNHNNSVFLALTGRQGTGKTVFQYWIDDILNLPSIHIYTKEEFNFLMRGEEFPIKHHIAIMDGTLLFPSRDFSSKDQKQLQRQVNVLRAFQNVYSISFPFFEEADKTIQRHFYECKLSKTSSRRYVKIVNSENEYSIEIPNFSKEKIEQIHQLDRKYKSSNLI